MHPHAGTAQKPPSEPVAVCVAVAVTVLWHGALLGWLSALAVQLRDASNAAPAGDTIDIVFVPRRDAAVLPADSADPAVTPEAPAAARVVPMPASDSTGARPAETSLPEATAGRIDVVTGDDQWLPSPSPSPSPSRAAIVPRIVIPPRNPLARVDRHALDVAPRLQVRMRAPRSVEAWLKMLAPAGYEADPCPELARAIAGLASDSATESRALVDDAVAFEARYCR